MKSAAKIHQKTSFGKDTKKKGRPEASLCVIIEDDFSSDV